MLKKTDADNNVGCTILYALRSIMGDVARDNRVVSMANRAGFRNQLTQMLDQLQRCQKSLNEFLEVRVTFYLCYIKSLLIS